MSLAMLDPERRFTVAGLTSPAIVLLAAFDVDSNILFQSKDSVFKDSISPYN